MKEISGRSLLSLFFTSSALFGFFLLTSPLISTIFSGFDLYFLFASPFFASALAALVVLVWPQKRFTQLSLEVVNFLTLISIPAVLIGLSQIQSDIDAQVVAAGTGNMTVRSYLQAVQPFLWEAHKSVLLVLIAPYFFYGLLLTQYFRQVQRDDLPKLYLYELLGIVSGFGLSCFLLDYGSFNLLLICGSSLAVASVWLLNEGWRKWSLILFVPIVVHQLVSPLSYQPNRNINWVARDYVGEYEVEELRREWTTYAKVQTLRKSHKTKGYDVHVVALGDGSGHAGMFVGEFRPKNVYLTAPAAVIKALKPEKLLVLFAGAGADIVGIYGNMEDPPETQAVELNPAVYRAALAQEGAMLKEVLRSPKAKYILQESRLFLERTKEQYDAILYSWSGATFANFTGTRLHTTQYAFTRDAMLTAMQRLKDDGFVAIFGSNKVKGILSFFRLTEEMGWPHPANSVVVFTPKGIDPGMWKKSWDDFIAVLKKGEWTPGEVENLKVILAEMNYEIAYSPFTEEVPLPIFSDIMSFKSSVRATQYVESRVAWKIDTYSDDRPFLSLSSIPADLMSFSYWKSKVFNLKIGFDREDLAGRTLLVLFILVLIFIVVTLLKGRGSFTLYWNLPAQFLLGFASSAMIMIYTYKTILFLGNPTHAVALSQGGGLFFSACAALWCQRKIEHNRFHYLLVVLMMSLSLLALSEWIMVPETKFFFTPFFGGLLFFAIVAPITFGISYFYLQSLNVVKLKSNRSIPFFLMINLTASAFASILIPSMIQFSGLRATAQLVGLAIFTAALILFWLRHVLKKSGLV